MDDLIRTANKCIESLTIRIALHPSVTFSYILPFDAVCFCDTVEMPFTLDTVRTRKVAVELRCSRAG